jgi:hypothetical protein
MSRPATAWIDDVEEATVISEELFDSTIGFIRSDVADVKAEVRELRSLQHAQANKLDAFREKLDEFREGLERKIDEKVTALERKMDERFAAADKRNDERFAAAAKATDERFAKADDRFLRVEKTLERVVVWQKAIMWYLTLLLALGSAMFTAMAKGFHWF